jgi:hypothetical protein
MKTATAAHINRIHQGHNRHHSSTTMGRGKKVHHGQQSTKAGKRNFKTQSKKTGAVQQAITSWLIVKPKNHAEDKTPPKSKLSLDTNESATHGCVLMEDPVEIKIRAHEWLCFYKYDFDDTKRGLCCPFQHLCGTKSLRGIEGVRQHLLHEGIHPPVYKEMFKRVEDEYHQRTQREPSWYYY